MKRTIITTLVILSSLIMAAPATKAQTTEPDPIFVNKTITAGEGENYTLQLTSYVTGTSQTVVTETTEPVDIIMVIDKSASMNSVKMNGESLPLWQYVDAAAAAFVNTVYEYTPKDENGNPTGYHNLGIVNFGNNLTYGQEKIPLQSLTSANLSTYLDEVNYDSSTFSGNKRADLGFQKANEMFSADAIKSDGRKKVLLFFTMGAPNDKAGGNESMGTAIAVNAVNEAHEMKQDGVTVYSVAVLNDETSKNGSNLDIRRFLHYASSNYNFQIAGSDYKFADNYTNINGGAENPHDYYRLSDGTDLQDIFTMIAHSATQGGSSYQLDSKATIIDVMSNDFIIPEYNANGDPYTEDDIRVRIETCDGDPSIPDSWSPAVAGMESTLNADGTDEDGNQHLSVSMDVVNGKQRVLVSGFDYSLDDHRTNGTVDQYGNWVGDRHEGGPSGDYHGNRIVIEFDVQLSEDYVPGFGVPSNDSSSAIYYPDEEGDLKPVIPYPVPKEDFPAICIMKNGLKFGDSAIFDISDNTGVFMTVVLTQKDETPNDGGILDPCYVLIKNLEENKQYTVTEKSWSWTYTPGTTSMTRTLYELTTPDGYSSAADYVQKTGTALDNNIPVGKSVTANVNGTDYEYCSLYNDEGELYDNAPVLLLFKFSNIEKTDNLPANAEAVVHNKFAGGSANSGGTSVSPTDIDDEFEN